MYNAMTLDSIYYVLNQLPSEKYLMILKIKIK